MRLRLILTMIFLPVALVMGWQAKKQRIADYQLSEADIVVYEKCERAMSANELKFNGGASNGDGCACMAKHATAEFEPKYIPAFNDVMSVKLKMAKKGLKDNDAELDMKTMMDGLERINKVQSKHELNDTVFLKLLSESTDYISFCGDGKNHTEENVSKIAMMTPKPASRKTPRTYENNEKVALAPPQLRR